MSILIGLIIVFLALTIILFVFDVPVGGIISLILGLIAIISAIIGYIKNGKGNPKTTNSGFNGTNIKYSATTNEKELFYKRTGMTFDEYIENAKSYTLKNAGVDLDDNRNNSVSMRISDNFFSLYKTYEDVNGQMCGDVEWYKKEFYIFDNASPDVGYLAKHHYPMSAFKECNLDGSSLLLNFDFEGKTMKIKIDLSNLNLTVAKGVCDIFGVSLPEAIGKDFKDFCSKFEEEIGFNPEVGYGDVSSVEICSANYEQYGWRLFTAFDKRMFIVQKDKYSQVNEELIKLQEPSVFKNLDVNKYKKMYLPLKNILYIEGDLNEEKHSYKGSGASTLGTMIREDLFGTAAAINYANQKSQTRTYEYKNLKIKIYVKKEIYGFEHITIEDPAMSPDRPLNEIQSFLLELSKSSKSKENYLLSKENDEDSPKKKESFSNADEIRKYKSLLDDGIISQEEFEQKKKELLNL